MKRPLSFTRRSRMYVPHPNAAGAQRQRAAAGTSNNRKQRLARVPRYHLWIGLIGFSPVIGTGTRTPARMAPFAVRTLHGIARAVIEVVDAGVGGTEVGFCPAGTG